MSGVQSIRLRRPTTDKTEENPKPKPIQKNTLLHEQVRKTHRIWTPSFSLAVRVLLLIRVAGAMYSNMDDFYNFWEPLHLFAEGYGFKTWELSPTFALRSWAYIITHYLPVRLGKLLGGGDKRVMFFGVRILLAMTSGLAEAAFYRAVVDNISMKVGRYLFFMLAFSAGMWNSSAAFLPSSFAMYATMLAYSFAMKPSSLSDNRRTLASTILFATGAIVGWPFALALSLPFVFEELFVFSGDSVSPEEKLSWISKRWFRMATSVLAAALIFIPVIGIDSLAYGKLEIVPWNLIRYNIFGGEERGPNLYGTAPWTFYFNNLILNFNILVPLALLSLPALAITYNVDRRRLGYAAPSSNNSSPFTILALRLAPFYLWLLILTIQPHKEERFMFPSYPLLCFNAAMTVYLARGWMEVAFIKVTKSPYQASRTAMFRNFTFSIIVGTIVISLARVVALYKYYHAPMSVVFNFQMHELPRLLNDTGLLPVYPASLPEDERPVIDLTPIQEFNLTLCYGKEWHRFPGHFLVPNGVRVEFIKSEFDGLLPGHFALPPNNEVAPSRWWSRSQTRYAQPGFNDLNLEEPSHHVPIEQCDYLVDLDFPKNPASSKLEPRYAQDSATWERVSCVDFLDTRHSMLLTRVLWFPGEAWSRNNQFGDYCVLKNKESVTEKEAKVTRRFSDNPLY